MLIYKHKWTQPLLKACKKKVYERVGNMSKDQQIPPKSNISMPVNMSTPESG